MPELYLNKVGQEYVDKGYTIKVIKTPYKGFSIFEKIRFIDVDQIPFNYFSIIKHDNKGKAIYMYDYDSRTDFKLDNIEFVDLYFSKSNSSNLLILKVSNAGKYKYYKYTDFTLNKEIAIKNISNEFKLEGNLSEHLITQNDLLNGTLTYRLDKKQDYNNIKIEKKQDSKLDGYTIYIHKMNDKKFKKNKSLVLYKKTLFEVNPKLKISIFEIHNVQEVIFESISVYFLNDTNNDVPSLVHFIYYNKHKENDKKHYFFTKNKYEKYWRSVLVDYNGDHELDKIKEWLDEYYFTHNNSLKVIMTNKYHYSFTRLADPTEGKSDTRIKLKTSKINDTAKVSVLKYSDYLCYNHNFGPYFGKIEKGKFNLSILRPFISSKEISILNTNDISYLLHTSYNYNVHVYIFEGDHFPLLLKFGTDFYGPKTKDKYFVEWENIEDLKGIEENKLFDAGIENKLNDINSMLNEIDIQKTSDYGVDDSEFINEFYNEDHECQTRACEIYCRSRRKDMLSKQFDYTRIKVTEEDFDVYKKFTHKTKNGFKIGNIIYNHEYLSDNKLKIEVGQELTSVCVYFFKFEINNTNKFPLLIEFTISDSDPKYYVFKPDNPKDIKKIEIQNADIKNKEVDLINILDHQNCILNKVMSLNLDKKENYSICNVDIKKENLDEICVNEVIISEDPSLKKSKYKLFRHHTGELDNKLDKDKVSLKDMFNPEIYKTPIRVKNFNISNKFIHLKNIKDKNIDNLLEVRAAYVHFYGDDPRPLLIYSGKMAFAPKNLDTYYNEWFAIDKIGNSSSEFVKYDLLGIEDKLDEIVHFMNPVDISQPCTYTIDKFEEKEIKIKVDSEDILFFRKHKHSPFSNQRLGIVKFREHKVLGDHENHRYNSYLLDDVSAYYYQSDRDYDYPFLVELNIKGQDHKLYFQLVSTYPYKWEQVSYSEIKGIFEKDSILSILKNPKLKFNEIIPTYIKNMYRIFDLNCDKVPSKLGPYHFKTEGFSSSGYEEYTHSRDNQRRNTINSFHDTERERHPRPSSDRTHVHGSHFAFEDDTYGEVPLEITTANHLIEFDYTNGEYKPLDGDRKTYVPKTVEVQVVPATGEKQSETPAEGTTSRLPGVIGGVLGSVGVVGGGGFALYKFLGPGIIDMRPIF